MNGIENHNKMAFDKAETLLRNKGYNVVNPHSIPDPMGVFTYVDYMRMDIRALLDCDAIYLLKGWEFSNGAKLEQSIASMLKMEHCFEKDD
jgi:hypothetical protein